MMISELKSQARREPVEAEVVVQLVQTQERETRDGKPFLTVEFADLSGTINLQAWSSHPQFDMLQTLKVQTVVHLIGVFQSGNFGVESRQWTVKLAEAETRNAFFSRQHSEHRSMLQEMQTMVQSWQSEPLKTVALLFLDEFSSRLLRTGAARYYHHARRGGLIEHTLQMMRHAQALSSVEPRVDGELLMAGALFHDVGKMWENVYNEESLEMPYLAPGELLGHIILGIELVNRLWRRCNPPDEQEAEARKKNEELRLHLLHLIASHHGELQFGSPVVPKTPEAFALHSIDALDAQLEMTAQAFAESRELGENIVERYRPLPGNLVRRSTN
ncbi:MAG: HD domain-containing protein [Verrucomicrobiales bacterium]